MAYNLVPDASPIANLLSRMGQERRAGEAQNALTQLVGQARGGDTNAINQLLVQNPQLGQFAMQEQAAQSQAMQKEQEEREALFASRMLGVPVEQRAAYIQQGVQQGLVDEEDFMEYQDILRGSVEQQNKAISDILKVGGYENLLPTPTSGKVGTIRYVDAGATIEARDTRDNSLLEVIQKTTPEGKKIEQELKSEEIRERTAERKEKREVKQRERLEATQGLIDQADTGLDLIGQIKSHPGFKSAVGAKGASSLWGFMDEPIAGTDAAGVVSLIDTLEAQNFLAGIKQFKAGGGAGSLSDAEGRKLGAAVANLKRSQKESDFMRNLNIIETLLMKQKRNARSKLGDTPQPAQSDTVDWNSLP